MSGKFLSPKEIASLLGISMATVNYYTNIGLFRAEGRKGNMRLYSKAGILKIFPRYKNCARKVILSSLFRTTYNKLKFQRGR